MIMIRSFVLFFAVLAVASSMATAQVRFRVAAGLSTDWITNDNPATYRLSGQGDDFDTTDAFGGGFDGVQVGWGIKGFADLDKQKMFRVPFGIDFWSYSGAQSISGSRSKISVRHEVVLTSASAGFEWSFVEFPLAYARAYIGAEARVTNVGENTITTNRTIVVDTNRIIEDEFVKNGKPAATRLGAMARLGIEGEIYYPIFLNTSVSWGVMNLIGRDTRSTADGGRGELLTPVSVNEGPESVVQHINFTFMIQVRI